MLHVHRSHRTEALVERLGELLAEPLPDPMQPERILVGSRGTERWLTAELAVRSPAGVLANAVVDTPRRFVRWIVDEVLGAPPDDAVDPWDPAALAWTLAGRLPDAIAASPTAFAAIAGYLGIEPRDSPDGVEEETGQLALPVDEEALARAAVVDRRLLGFATRTAALFDDYALYRPAMVRAWEDGRDVDGVGRPLGRERWQAALWRTVAAQQSGTASTAARIGDAAGRLAAGHRLAEHAVPSRLLAFGVSTLPPLHLDLLAQVARQREVHLLVPSPSPRSWRLGWERAGDEVQPRNALLRAAGPVGRDVATLVHDVVDHHRVPVVGAGTGEAGGGGTRAADDAGRVTSGRPAGTLLARLQADVAVDEPLPDAPRGPDADGDGPTPATGHDGRVIEPDDRSIVFHDCHGAVRQVEALRDELLRRFDADPTLQPRHVAVLTPDLATFAPLVTAVFADPRGRRHLDGRSHGGDPPTVPVAVADRSAGRGNPVAAVLTRVLALVHARTSGAEVLDLLSTEPVRARFRLSPAELVTVQRWVEETGVAWARDEEDRARHRQPARREHTWAAGLDRLLVGVAMADEGARTVGGVVPYDAVEDSGDLDLLDRLTRFLDVVDDLVDLTRPRSVTEWAADLGELLDRLTGPADGLPWLDERRRHDHRRDRERVDRVLTGLGVAEAAVARDVDVRAVTRWLGQALDEAAGSAGHGTGAVTVAELVPLRAIPFRVLCLLGMDTGGFPRSSTPPGHDLAARDPRPGDRDRRAADRALFLEAVHAAQEALVVTYAGRDPVSGRPQPPAIPVAELRDAVAAYVGADGLARRTVVHPVLPTGPAAFDVDLPDGPVSYDRVRLEAARAALAGPAPPPPFVDGRLPADDAVDDHDVVALTTLTRVLARPARALLDRLRIARPEDLRTFPETEPLDVDPLQRWQLGTDLLAAAEEHVDDDLDHDELVRIALARGRLPAGAVGRHAVRDVVDVATRMTACLDALGPREHRHVVADVGAVRVEGRVRLAVGDRVQLVETWYGRADGRRHLRAWLRHLVAAVALPDEPTRTVVQCRARYGGGVDVHVYPPVDPDRARHELAGWLELYERAGRERVPFVPKVSWTYAAGRREAERLAATVDGVSLADVEALSDTELMFEHGSVAGRGRTNVWTLVERALDAAHDAWGRDVGGHGFPERDSDEIRLVFREVLRWDDLLRTTDLLDVGVVRLRPLVDATLDGRDEARTVCP